MKEWADNVPIWSSLTLLQERAYRRLRFKTSRKYMRMAPEHPNNRPFTPVWQCSSRRLFKEHRPRISRYGRSMYRQAFNSLHPQATTQMAHSWPVEHRFLQTCCHTYRLLHRRFRLRLHRYQINPSHRYTPRTVPRTCQTALPHQTMAAAAAGIARTAVKPRRSDSRCSTRRHNRGAA